MALVLLVPLLATCAGRHPREPHETADGRRRPRRPRAGPDVFAGQSEGTAWIWENTDGKVRSRSTRSP